MKTEVLKESERIYLDYNATTPLARIVQDKIPEWLSFWGNPNSIHKTGQAAKNLIWTARSQIAKFIGCHPLEIIFTSGGSESNNHTIKGLCHQFRNIDRKKIITSAVEHPSVMNTLKEQEKEGFDIKIIPVSKEGVLDLDQFQKELDEHTAFVTIMYANNETGCIFPIKKLAQMSAEKGCLFHSDAIQALGKIPLDVRDLGLDLMSLSAHKFYALKGCGVLYCKKNIQIDNLIHGGAQERRRRAGTENTLGIASFGAVAQIGELILEENKKIKILRDELEHQLIKEISNIKIIGKNSDRIGNSSSIWIPGIFSETVMINLDLKGYSVSVSSACHSGSISPSTVLLGMGFSPEEAKCILRISLGLGIDQKSLQKFVLDLKQIVERLRNLES